MEIPLAFWLYWIPVVLFLFPAYLANGAAVVVGKRSRTPVDFGLKWADGRRVLGAGKTWRGTLGGAVFGAGVAALLALLVPAVNEVVPYYALYGVLAAVGAIGGDMAGSFLKRRAGLESGRPVLLLDQLDFVAGAYLLTLPLYVPSAAQVAFVVGFTLAVHVATNQLAYRVGLKKVPW